MIFQAPQAYSATPTRPNRCTSIYFALDECPSTPEIGLITIYANYEGNSDKLLGTAPIYDLVPGPNETTRFSFVVPTLDFR